MATNAQVAIVSEAFAKHFWPHQSALGKQLNGGPNNRPQIVAVVGDVRHNGLAASSMPEVYFPLTRDFATGQNAMNIVGRVLRPLRLLRRCGRPQGRKQAAAQ